MDVFTDCHSGHKFIMNTGGDCYNDFKKNGIPEWSLIEWSRQFCSPDKLFVDIGAHMGIYCMNLSACSKHVYAFEIQKSTYEGLVGGIILNGITNITPHNIGLSNEEGTMKLYKVSPDGGGSTLDLAIAEHEKPEHTVEMVTVRTLDSFNLDNIGFLKLDVEGSELNVIKGAVNTLRRSNWPKFIFEAWPDDWYADARTELITYVESLGYTVTIIRGYNNMYLAHR